MSRHKRLLAPSSINSIVLALLLALHSGPGATQQAAQTGEFKDVYYTQSDSADQRHLDVGQRWRFRYIDEGVTGFELKNLEESLDERLANIIYTMQLAKPLSMDYFTFNSGDPREDARNMDLVAGPQVDDATCGRHLKEMLRLHEEFNARLAKKRSNSNYSLALDERHVRLARVFDSYGRYEPGHLSGKTHSPGQHDQCVNTHLLLGKVPGEAAQTSKAEKVGTSFCWAHLSLNKRLNYKLKRHDTHPSESHFQNVLIGICLPRSCHSKTFAKNRALIQRLVDSQFKLPQNLFIDETLKVGSVFCMVDSESAYASLPLAGKLAVIFFTTWLALALYATYGARNTHDKQQRQVSTTQSTFLECLNLRKSWQDFVGQFSDPAAQAKHESACRNRKIELDALNPVKVLGCAFVVAGHALIMYGNVSQNSTATYRRVETDRLLLGMIVGTSIVDSFFVITGIFLGYIAMKRSKQGDAKELPGAKTLPAQVKGIERPTSSSSSTAAAAAAAAAVARANGGIGSKTDEKIKSKKNSLAVQFLTQWLKISVARHLRLVPLFFLVFWIKKSVLISYFAGWPLWDSGFNKDTNYGACRLESWSTPFSVMAAFLPLSKQCLPQAWSVASDLFFSLTCAPIMLIMPRKPKLALSIAIVMMLVSTIWTFNEINSIDPHMAYELNDIRSHGFVHMFGNIHHLYTYPHLRMCSVLIGMIAGYYLYFFGEQSDELKRWPRWFSGWATKASAAYLTLVLVGFSNMSTLKYYFAPHHQSLYTNILTIGRIMWASTHAVLFMRLVSDWRQNALVRMMSGRFWQTLSRLNLAILLIHVDVLWFFINSEPDYGYFTKTSLFGSFGRAYFYCVPIAVFLHVVYENPIDKLTRKLLMPK